MGTLYIPRHKHNIYKHGFYLMIRMKRECYNDFVKLYVSRQP